MSAAMIAALVFTVALLVTTAYFIMGGLPLLVLQHDTPLDARFVRAFFNLYYRAAVFTAMATAACYALAGRAVLAAGAAVIAMIALALRQQVIPRMDRLGQHIQGNVIDAIPGFRKTHVTAIVLIVFSPAVSSFASGKEVASAMFPKAFFAWFPYDNPAIVSVPVGFLLGILGTLSSGKGGPEFPAKQAEMEVRSMTGAGAEGAIAH